jgi:hypothetical protein
LGHARDVRSVTPASQTLRKLDFDLDTDAELFTCLRPEICAVVEAAEKVDSGMYYAPLRVALSALQAALGETP